MDDPLVLLSTIKDDDHLAAYKLPNLARSTVFLQLVHRQGELYVLSDSWHYVGIFHFDYCDDANGEAMHFNECQMFVHGCLTALWDMFKSTRNLILNV